MKGVSVSLIYGNINDVQQGVSVGAYNITEQLHGFQFGLINYAHNNRKIFRLTPFFNFNLRNKPKLPRSD